MDFLNVVKQKVGGFASENATLLLTVGGVVGTVATGVLAARGGYRYAQVLAEKKGNRIIEVVEATQEGNAEGTSSEFKEAMTLSKTDKAVMALPYALPPIVTGGATIAAIIFSHRMSSAKIAGLAAAYGLAERNLSEYKDKVTEKLTGPKKQSIDDELAQESVDRTPGSDKIVFVEGEVLCFDKPTGRYFNSTMETIKQAVNSTNAEIFNHGYARASFFYNELGLDDTTWSDEVGFTTENLLDLTYTTILAPGNRPCIAIDFTRLPKADFHPKYD